MNVNTLWAAVAGAVAGIAVIGGSVLGLTSKNDRLDYTSVSDDFISTCSGVYLTNQAAYHVATANCMGRIGGFVAGHSMTVELNKMYIADSGQDVNLPAMWCVPADVSDITLMQTTINWIKTNPSEHARIISEYQGVTGALIVATKAIGEKYPCTAS